MHLQRQDSALPGPARLRVPPHQAHIALFGDFCHARPIRQPEPAEWYYTHKLEFTEDWPPREDMFEGWRV